MKIRLRFAKTFNKNKTKSYLEKSVRGSEGIIKVFKVFLSYKNV